MNTDTSKKTFLLVEGALMIAMAFVLSYIKLYDMPMGGCLLYTSPSPRDRTRSRMPSSA